MEAMTEGMKKMYDQSKQKHIDKHKKVENYKAGTFVHNTASLEHAKEVLYNQPNMFLDDAEDFVIDIEMQMEKIEGT